MTTIPALPRLTPGETIRCPRCHRDHVVEQPYPESTTADREYVYVTCRGDRYFVGFVKRL